FTKEAGEAMHFKDLVDPRHGEYTHRIQWYLAITQGKLCTKPVSDLFIRVNDFGTFPNLWDLLFDRGTAESSNLIKAVATSDYRCPEYFTDYLTSDGAVAKFPLLCSFLKCRREKRTAKEDPYDPLTYLARKLNLIPRDANY